MILISGKYNVFFIEGSAAVSRDGANNSIKTTGEQCENENVRPML